MGHDVFFLFFFGVHANCPNFVPLKKKKERNKGGGGGKKQRKEDMRIYQIKKRGRQKKKEMREGGRLYCR